MLTGLLGVLGVLLALIVVVWVAREVLAYFQAPHVVWVIVSAMACIAALVMVARIMGVPLGLG